MTAPHTTPDLQAAWAAMRKRPAFRNWPQDFEQVMADPVRMRQVRLEATGLSRCRAKCLPPVDLPYRPRIQVLPSRAPIFDRKRAASGERDDD
jgi:hypothetical protein